MQQTLTQTFARPLIALALAAGIALSPVSAAPARANNNDAAAFFAALLAMGLVVSTLNNGAAAAQGGHEGNVVDLPRRTKALPQSCIRKYETRRGNERYFSKRCLRKNYARWNQLPQRCARTIQAFNRRGLLVRRAVYEIRCLRRAGYHASARR